MTNGWRGPGPLLLFPVEQVELFQTRDPQAVEGWSQIGGVSEEDDLSEEAHRVYGEDQDAESFRRAYLRTAVQIGEPGPLAYGDTTYLLNPEVVTPEGEWEAWLLNSKLLGAMRWRSFWDLLQAEYTYLLTQE